MILEDDDQLYVRIENVVNPIFKECQMVSRSQKKIYDFRYMNYQTERSHFTQPWNKSKYVHIVSIHGKIYVIINIYRIS